MRNEGACGQLHVTERREGHCNPVKIAQNERQQDRIWHVPGRDLQQSQWRPMQNVGRHKVTILADDDAPLKVSQAGDVRVAAAVLVREGQRVDGIVPCGRQGARELYWQLRINDELHAARSSTWLVCVRRAAYARAA